jgi:hypothetical protein
MNRKTTDLHFVGKCGAFGAKGFAAAESSAAAIAENASEPNPHPARRRKSRRF